MQRAHPPRNPLRLLTQCFPPARLQRLHPHPAHRPRPAPARRASRCRASILPARRSVRGPGMLGADIAVRQHRPITMPCLPVVRNPTCRLRQHMRGKVRNPHRRQEQEAVVVHHPPQPRATGSRAPADIPASSPRRSRSHPNTRTETISPDTRPAPSGASSPRRSRSHPNTRTETISPDSSTSCRDAAEPPPDGATPSSNGSAANPRDPRPVPATPFPEPIASSPHAGLDATAMHPPPPAALPPPGASTPVATPASAGSSAPTKRTARPARCASSRERTTRSQARSGSRLPQGPRTQTTKEFPRKTVASQSACIMCATQHSPC